jgi:serine O-acetyltransferase
MISAGAKVLGSFTVGENSKIGAGSVVLEEVPPNCTVVGVPGRIVKRDNIAIPRDTMDQVHLPDPVKEDINRLQSANVQLLEKLEALEMQMEELKKNVK